MANILIVGCGYVGSELAGRLSKAGHEVWGLRRNPTNLPEGVHSLQADVLQSQSLMSAIPSEIDYAAYCVSSRERSESAYRDAYVTGLRNVLGALQARCPGLHRVIFTSSTGVYGQNRGEWVDEDSPTQPGNFSGAQVLEGESTLRNSGLPSVIVRFSGIYGPGRDRLVQLAQTGYELTAQDEAYTNRIHRDDCAGAIEHLLFLERPAEIFIGSDCEPASRDELLRWLAKRIGVELHNAMYDKLSHDVPMNKRLSNQRLLESGYRFIYPTYREGFTSLI
jgi:nucleoside-diphosphate-sugar epimerase